MSSPVARRASARVPCPVCSSGTKRCSVTKDGLHLCRGEPVHPSRWNAIGQLDSAGFWHYRDADDNRHKGNGLSKGPRPVIGSGKDWRELAERYAGALTPKLRSELASAINLPIRAIEASPLIGWDGEAWTFPEYDGDFCIIGLCRRFPDGSKLSAKDGKRGLSVPVGWLRDTAPGPVLVVEGWSDALALSLCGLCTIGRPSNTGGAEHLTQALRGVDRPIIIVGENDPKSDGSWPGRDGALSVATKLADTLRRPVRWSMPPTDYKDARDWIRDLIASAAETVDYAACGREIATHLEAHAATIGVEEPPLPLLYYCEIAPALDAVDFVESLLIDGAMSVIYGESGCGKTFFALDLALHVAAGIPWRGREVDRRGVLYLALEGSHGIKNRVAAFKLAHMANCADLSFAVVPVALNLLDPAADTDKVIAAAKTAADKLSVPVGLIVVDTLSRAMAGGNENGPEDMGDFVRNIDKIRRALPAHVAVIHHSGKDGARGARGHSLLRAATDTEIEVSRDPTISTARVTKQRELDAEGEFAFRLVSVELGLNRRGKPVTSCVVREADAPTKDAKLTPDEQAALNTLFDLLKNQGSTGFPGIPEGTASVPEAVWRESFYAACKPGAKPDTRQKAYRRAVDGLIAAKRVSAWDDRVWITTRTNPDKPGHVRFGPPDKTGQGS